MIYFRNMNSLDGSVSRSEESTGRRQWSWWIGIAASIAAGTAWIMVIAIPGAPPRSGPNCTGHFEPCLTYPYTDAAEYVPGDFLWMVPAFFLGPLVLALVTALLADVPEARRPLAWFASAVATISAATLMIDYYVQFTTVQTSLVRGETGAGLSLLSQFNPHGVFIALEDVGYLTMLAALAVTAVAMPRSGRAGQVLRWLFLVAGTIGTLALPVLLAVVGHDLEYWYELLAIVIAWTTVLVGGFLAAAVLRAR